MFNKSDVHRGKTHGRYGCFTEADLGRRHEAAAGRDRQGEGDEACRSASPSSTPAVICWRSPAWTARSRSRSTPSLMKAMTAASYGIPTGDIAAGIDLKLAIATQGKRINLPGGLPDHRRRPRHRRHRRRLRHRRAGPPGRQCGTHRFCRRQDVLVLLRQKWSRATLLRPLPRIPGLPLIALAMRDHNGRDRGHRRTAIFLPQ